MSRTSISDRALNLVTERLGGLGSSLGNEGRAAIAALLRTLEAGLSSTLDAGYHLASIDPGMGKSLSIASFLQAWKAEGFRSAPAGSVLIGLSRLDEIESYIMALGLADDEFAVFTSDTRFANLGLPKDRRGEARVLLTTQQMIEQRTRGKSFQSASEFQYQDGPRSLLIWDESLTPAVPLSVSVDSLAGQLQSLRNGDPRAAEELQKFIVAAWSSPIGATATVPQMLAQELARAAPLEGLGRLAGREVAILDKSAGKDDRHISGSSCALPTDFSPVVILDASGRVRKTYDIWQANGGRLHRLPSAANDYSKLRIRLWNRAVGRDALRNKAVCDEIAQAVVDAIHDKPAEDWLIVSYKLREGAEVSSIEQAVRSKLGGDGVGHINFLTWGMHHGTNAYAHCKNVVLVGQLTYGDLGYRALTSACGGSAAEAPEKRLRDGEYQHGYLQAIMRGSARKSQGGMAGVCTAHVIASPPIGAEKLLGDTFPGCSIEPWEPVVPEVAGLAGRLIGLLQDVKSRGDLAIRKQDIAEALSIPKQGLTKLLGKPAIVAFVGQNHIEIAARELRFPPLGFAPWPDGGWTFDDVDAA